jgi:hypothetical protein
MNKKNKEKVLDVITECNILRLKPDEALELIQKETGIKISDRSYRRYKKEIQNKVNERLEYLGRTEIMSEHIQSIDLYKKIERELWKNYHATDSIPTKKSILESIGKSHFYLGLYYNHENVIDGFKRWLDDEIIELDNKRNSAKPDRPKPILTWPIEVPVTKRR